MITPDLAKIIDTLKTVESMGKLRMCEGIVWDKQRSKRFQHECGTTHCIAGWYVVAKIMADKDHELHALDSVGYMSGVEMINADAGVNLRDWAYRYPGIWGNDRGAEIWTTKFAWKESWSLIWPNGLTDVIQFLRGVDERIDDAKSEARYC